MKLSMLSLLIRPLLWGNRNSIVYLFLEGVEPLITATYSAMGNVWYAAKRGNNIDWGRKSLNLV